MQKAVGCDRCYKSGYSGRTGIYEVIKIDKEIEALIFSGALKSTIEAAAIKAGTSLMFRQALRKVIQHVTSMDEVYRVVADG
jgi:type II secretory ATPase GspE/PulE/Tfp pilus assembly ATPase PilB-like protein